MRRQRKLMNQINVVPYIDVMLVLLVIFMVTAPMIQTGNIDLPSVGKTSQPAVAPLEIIIKPNMSLALINRAAGEKETPISRETLTQAIQAAQEKNPEQSVLIAADKNVKYDIVMKIMDTLQRAHVTKIGLLVHPTR